MSIIAIGVFYAFSLFAVAVGTGPNSLVAKATENPQTLVTELAWTFLGVFGQDAVQILVLVSLFGCFLTFHNVLARFTFNFGAAGLLPRHWAGPIPVITHRRGHRLQSPRTASSPSPDPSYWDWIQCSICTRGSPAQPLWESSC